MVSRTISAFDNDLLTVSSGSPSLTPGSPVINNSDTPDGTIFVFSGGAPSTVTIDDTGGSQDVLEDDRFAEHRITDGAGLVGTGTGIEAESLIFLRALDEFGNQIGPTITITVFSQDSVTQNIWGFHSDTKLDPGTEYVKTGGNNIGSASYSRIANAPVCYAPGTMIDTPEGPRRVETLQDGDLVMTLDHGPQAIRWTHSGILPLEKAEGDYKPVQIRVGALGRGRPAQDLIVSPQHRILVGAAGQLDRVFTTEAFAPAKSLTGVPGIRHMKGIKEITWVHFACDRHEVVTANGCLSESLLLGPMVMNGLSAVERRALTDLFGPAATLDAALNGPAARDCLTVGAVKGQLSKHLKEKGHLVAKEIRTWDRDLAMEEYEAERMREALPVARAC